MMKNHKTMIFSIFTVMAITLISTIAINSIHKTAKAITNFDDISWDI